MQARTATIPFIALLIALVLPGSRAAPSQTQARKAPAPSGNASVVFEIIEKDARPHVSGDEYLYFRLYQDGTAEFEMSHLGMPLNQGVTLNRIRLNKDEQDELTNLAGLCIDFPGDFDPMQRLEEKVAISTITVRGQDGDYHQTVIHHYSPENEKTKLYFPRAAKDLMKQVDYLRRELTVARATFRDLVTNSEGNGARTG
ncbi:MAG TPA: hypothetical protein VKJ45_09950 [Blastocatellia bacterium]|nr:hypothetical protein [Blastocatellia bacterium]